MDKANRPPTDGDLDLIDRLPVIGRGGADLDRSLGAGCLLGLVAGLLLVIVLKRFLHLSWTGLGVAAVVAWVLAVEQVPAQLIKAMAAMSAGPIMFLVLTALLFILLGAVLEGLPAVVILLPTFLPVAKTLGIDLVHYSIVIVAATGIGLFLPPIGVGLFISCGIAGIKMDQVVRPMMPYVGFLCLGLLLVILFPWITLVVPRLFNL